MKSKIKYILVVFLLSFLISNIVFSQTFLGNYEIFESNGELFHEAGANDTRIDTDHVILKYQTNATESSINNFEQNNYLKNIGKHKDYYMYKLPANASYLSFCQDLSQNSLISYIEPSFYFEYFSTFTPDDPDVGDLEYLEILQVYEAWGITTGDSNVIVAVLDSGLEFTNEEFGPDDSPIANLHFNNPEENDWDDWDEPESGDIDNDDGYGYWYREWNYNSNPPGWDSTFIDYIDNWIGYDLVEDYDPITEMIIRDNNVLPDDCEAPDYYNPNKMHGTNVAGIIAAKTNNGEDIAGIAGGNIGEGKPGISLLPIKVGGVVQLGPNQYVPMGGTSIQFHEAILYADTLGADIINISMGIYSPSDFIESFINDVYDNGNGPLFVAAAGNSSGAQVAAPARFNSVIAVGATESNNTYWNSSSYTGGTLELMAPGVDILVFDGTIVEGTSLSTAMASATAALMLSINPDLTSSEIRLILQETAYKNPIYNYDNNGWNLRYGYGRINTFEAVCSALGYYGDVVVENNAVWDTPQVSTTDVVIEDDVTLTLTSILYMDPNAKVIVQPGGKFIIDGGTITTYPFCSGDSLKWKGIEVWGDADSTQKSTNGNYYQGYLELNNATIENAEIAVYLGYPEDADLNGGIIKAEGSAFKNNTKGVYFPEYHYMKVFSPTEEVELDNVSYIRFCNFSNDENYIDDADFDSHIKLHSVKGISIKQSTFNSGGRNGIGIDAFDAGFYVSGNCDNSMGCTPEEWEYSSFTGYDMAIYTRNATSPLYSINIYHSIFDNNQYGVFADNLDHVTNIRNSYFYVGKNTDSKEKSLCTEAYGRGIHISNSNNFHIEYNKFSLASGVTSSDNVIGIYAYNNPSEYDVIYSNEFTGFLLGNLAEETNRSVVGDDDKGLAYECNENFDNYIDFEINGDNPDLSQICIHTHQGTDVISAHNKYSDNSDPNAKHWRNMGTQVINYHLHTNENNTAYKPTKIETYNNGNYFTIASSASPNQCPDNDGSHQERTALSPEEIQEEELAYTEAYSDYQAIETIFNDLKDGGSTAGTTLTIASAQADDTWELRTNLLGKSPHLSKQVLMEAADRTDVLPNSVLLDVLAANPDELKKADFIEYLENKEEPLPDYMIEILEEVSTGTTYKTALLNQMNRYQAKKKRTANTILNSLLNEEFQDFNLIRNWLVNLGGLNADMKIVSTYIQEDNFTDATTLLNLIPDLYDLQGDALDLFTDNKDVLLLQMALKQSNRSLSDLTTAEITLLETWSTNNTGNARVFARNVLETHYGNNSFCDCINRNENKSSFAEWDFEEEKDSPLLVKASPNPAKHYVEFSYELSEIDQEGVIVITDIHGKQIHSFSVNYQKGVQVWDIRKIPTGSYIFTLKTKYFEKSGKLIIQ